MHNSVFGCDAVLINYLSIHLSIYLGNYESYNGTTKWVGALLLKSAAAHLLMELILAIFFINSAMNSRQMKFTLLKLLRMYKYLWYQLAFSRGNTLKWTCLNILLQSDYNWVKAFHFYFHSEQKMDKLVSESSEKSRCTYSTHKWSLFLTLYFISPDFSYCFIVVAAFFIFIYCNM